VRGATSIDASELLPAGAVDAAAVGLPVLLASDFRSAVDHGDAALVAEVAVARRMVHVIAAIVLLHVDLAGRTLAPALETRELRELFG